jgi:subtilisin family serine protease
VLLAQGAARPAAAHELAYRLAYRSARGELVGLREAPDLSTLDRLVLGLPDGSGTYSLRGGALVRLEVPSPAPPRAELAPLGLWPIRPLDRDGRTWLARAAGPHAVLEASRASGAAAGVRWVVPDFAVPIERARAPLDPYYARQWYLQQEGGAHIHAEQAWEITRGSPEVVVAVLDSGVDLEHPDLAGARILPGFSSLTGEADQTPLAHTYDAHGTCAAGLIVARADNGEGISGVCPGCALLPIQMMDSSTRESELSGAYLAIAHAAEQGAWVLSCSWSIDERYTSQIDMQPYREAIQDAVARGRGGLGAVVLFAAGNGNANDGSADAIGEHELQNLPEVMAVGGTGIDDRRVGYSNFGPNLSVMAPTGHFYPTRFGIFTTDTVGDRGFSRGGRLWVWQEQTDVMTEVVEPDEVGNYTAHFTGTSAACPLAAGVVALVFSAAPGLTGAEARALVEGTTDRVGGVDYGEDGHHAQYGHGRVNAGRAVRAARIGLGRPPGGLCAAGVNCALGRCLLPAPGEDHGLCATACEASEACAQGEVCLPLGPDQRACLPACAGHADCAGRSVCLEGGCREMRCLTGQDCPAGTACGPEGLCRHLVRVRGGCQAAGPGPAGAGWLGLLGAWLALWATRRRLPCVRRGAPTVSTGPGQVEAGPGTRP